MERKNHHEEHGLTRSSVPILLQNRRGLLRETASTTELRDETQNQLREIAVPETEHNHRTFASLRPHSTDLGPSRSVPDSTAPSSEARSFDTAARHRDALEMFEHYGISRPDGWLSEVESEVKLAQTKRTTQVCHSCGKQLTAQRFYGNCGHEACLKCLGELISRSPCIHQRTTNVKSSSRSLSSPFTAHKLHESHVYHHAHQYKHYKTEAGSSTPRPPMMHIISSVAEEENLPQLERKARVKTGFEGSGLVKDNPFFRTDRHMRGQATTAQASVELVRAHQPTRNSDYVPSRLLAEPYQSAASNGQCSKLSGAAKHTSHQPQGLQQNLEAFGSSKQEVVDGSTDGEPQEGREDYHQSLQADSLEGRIDQLYHHAQDMHQSQHILEHLAAGAYGLRGKHPSDGPATNGPTFSQAARSKVDLRLHSLEQDERTGVAFPEAVHGLERDEERPNYQHPVHDAREDGIVEVGRDIPTHKILTDHATPLSPPKLHDVSQDVLSNVEGWRRFHSGEEDTTRPSRDTKRLRPASPKSWMDRPAKMPRPIEGTQTSEGTVEVARRHRARAPETQSEHNRIQTGGHKVVEAERRLASPPELESDPWPDLKDLVTARDRKSSVAQAEPWSQTRLRKTSKDSALAYRDTTSQIVDQWRQKLKPVDQTQPRRSSAVEKPQEPVLRSVSQSRQDLRRRNTCLFCSRASSSSWSRRETTPCLVVQDDETGKEDHLVVSYSNPDHRHGHLHRSTIEPSQQRKLELKRVEESISRHASTVGLKDGHFPAASSRKGSLVHRLSHRANSNASLYHPQPIASTEHTCSWRTRYIDLSSEVEQMRSSLKSAHGKNAEAQNGHSCHEVGIEGLTIVMHMKGKDDLVINTDLTREGSVCERD